MFDVTYVEKLNLMVCAARTSSPISEEHKDRIRQEIKGNSGVENVIVIEGSFRCVGELAENFSLDNS